jgi:hypothetical protein
MMHVTKQKKFGVTKKRQVAQHAINTQNNNTQNNKSAKHINNIILIIDVFRKGCGDVNMLL